MAAIIPRPKYFKAHQGGFPLEKETRIVCDKRPACQAEAQGLAQRLKEMTGLNLKVTSGTRGKSEKNILALRLDKKLAGVSGSEEGYRIKATRQAVVLEARSDRGLFYAVQSLLDLLEGADGAWAIPACQVRDWPDFTWRGFLVDPARDFIPLPRLMGYVDDLARSKMNIFHIHFTDNEGFTIQSKRFPKLNEEFCHPMFHKGPRGCYSRDEIKELVSYAAQRKVEIIPEISVPSHSAQMVKLSPDLRCQVKDGYASETVLCAGSEKTYQFLEQLIAEIAPLFPAKTFHIGSDELDCVDVRYQGEIFCASSWRKCAVCHDRRKEEGLKTHRQLFYYFVNRVNGILQKHGKRLMMWNDGIDIAKPYTIPKDALIHFWQIALKHRGPRRGGSFAKFLKSGFQIVNSFYADAYIDGFIKEQRLARWHPAARPYGPPELRKQIIGSVMTAWCDHDYYPRVLPSAIPMFADRMWNKEKIEEVEAFAEMLPRHIFGPHLPKELDGIFALLGSIIPPLKLDDRAFLGDEVPLPGGSAKNKADCERLEKLLRKELRLRRVSNLSVLKEYLENVRWLKDHLE